MMIRSSSTPILGSLLPETPNHHHDVTLLHPYKSYSSPIHNKLSFHQTPSSPGSHHFTTLSCNSSPISPSFAGNNGGGIRRVQSEGNLESLMGSAGNDADDSDFSFFNPPKKLSTRLHHTCPLETIPSFSYQNSRFRSSDEEGEEEDDDIDEGFGGFNVENCKVLRVNNKEMGFGDLGVKDHDDGIIGETGSQMYLAKGLGIDAGFGCGSGGGGRNLSHVGGEGAAGGGGGGGDVEEEHYRKMVNECPGNALLLRNYAQFLYQKAKENSPPLSSMVQLDPFTESGFLAWQTTLRNLLRLFGKLYVIDRPIASIPSYLLNENSRSELQKHTDDDKDVTDLMLSSMTQDYRYNFMGMSAYDIIRKLKDLFELSQRTERADALSQFVNCSMANDSSPYDHVMLMKAYRDRLIDLGYSISDGMALDVVLRSLPEHYRILAINCSAQSIEEVIPLIPNVKIRTTPDVLKVANTKISKAKKVKEGKGKKPQVQPPEERLCYECNKMGHWRRNCPVYLAKLKMTKNPNKGCSSGT